MAYIFLGITFIVLLSSSIVCASDNSSTEANMTDTTQVNNEDSTTINSDTTMGTISDLKTDLDNCKGNFSLKRNYAYDNKKDSEIESDGISINKTDLVIEGNNHTINMKGYGTLFSLEESNVKISNLNIRNTKEYAISIEDSNLTTTHVNYESDNSTNTSAVNVLSSVYNSSYDTFTNLKHNRGSVMELEGDSNLFLTNATFNINHIQKYGLIYLKDSKANINNTLFANMQSEYSTAIYGKNGKVSIANSSFINLTAKHTAGAIGLRDISQGSITIDNCRFINVSSMNNAGAIYTDITGREIGNKAEVVINNSYFEDCHSDIGGAILQLGGILDIINSTFIHNYADIMGGAVYTSYSNLNIFNSSFTNNSVSLEYDDYSQGGAIFFDKEVLTINNSRFMDNNALKGADAYIYDAKYNILNSYFAENIYSMFDEDGSELKNNTFLENNTLNQKEYIYVYESNGSNIDYNPIFLNESLVNASYFDLRDYGLVTPVKNQGSMGACWAFGLTGALESAYLKASNKTALLDISESNIQNSALRYSIYGLEITIEGVDATVGASHMLSWLGVTTSQDNSYDELGKIGTIINNGTKYHVHNVVLIHPRKNTSDINKYKEALVKYGAIVVNVHGDLASNPSYNSKTYSVYYYNETFAKGADHAVTLIGWNDSFSRYNFKTTPPGDGAWILKNSWGSKWADDGYYYVSYYDTAFGADSSLAFIIDNNNSYEKNYQYDIIAFKIFEDYKENVSYQNKFTSIGSDLISAVGTYFNDSGVEYTINIYVNNELAHSQTGVSRYYGYETIKLDKFVGLKKDDEFIVQMSTGSLVPTSDISRQHYMENTSIVKRANKIIDLSDDGKVACLKAYTVPDNSIVNVTGDGDNTHVQYFDQDANPLAYTNVTVRYNNSNYSFTTDDDGFIILNLSLPKGRSDVTLINPINGREHNITIYVSNDDESIIDYPSNNNLDGYSVKYVKSVKRVGNVIKSFNDIKSSYNVMVNDKLIFEGRYFTIQSLNDIFNRSFIYGHLVVYLDGRVVFNSTVDDDLSAIIFEIINSLIGNHELKVEYTTDNENQTYTEYITIE